MARSALHSIMPAALMAALSGVKRMLPGPPVLTGDDLEHFVPAELPDVRYTGAAVVDHPVIPLQVFGLYYAVDLVVVSQHPRWDMHEYARIDTPEGPVWMAKDSDMNGVQTIVADREDVRSLVAEMPVPRLRGPVTVDDRSEGARVDLSLAYTNVDGDAVDLDFVGKIPRKAPGKRSGSTMGHSRQAAAVVLDIERQGLAGAVSMSIGGVKQKIDRLLGIYPLKFVLLQDQAGIAVTSFRTRSTEEGLHLSRPAGAEERDPATGEPGWPTEAEEDWIFSEGDGGVSTLTYSNELHTFRYSFLHGGLAKATVSQWERDGRDPLVLWMQPALPDLTRPFEGVAESRLRVDVNGQLGHGLGTIRTWWEDDQTVRVEVRPTEPWWFADRPMDGTITFPGDGSSVVQMVRVPTAEDAEED